MNLIGLLVFTASSLVPFDYDAIERLPVNETAVPPRLMAETYFSDATISRWWHDNEGYHVFIKVRNPRQKNVDPTKWETWTDGEGRPFLRRYLSPSEIIFWQSKSWKNWKFSSEPAWDNFYKHGCQDCTTPKFESYGVLTQPRLPGQSGTAPIRPIKTEQPGPCPGPGPCPRPSPGPNPFPLPDLPDLEVKHRHSVTPEVWVALAFAGGIAVILLAFSFVRKPPVYYLPSSQEGNS